MDGGPSTSKPNKLNGKNQEIANSRCATVRSISSNSEVERQVRVCRQVVLKTTGPRSSRLLAGMISLTHARVVVSAKLVRSLGFCACKSRKTPLYSIGIGACSLNISWTLLREARVMSVSECARCVRPQNLWRHFLGPVKRISQNRFCLSTKPLDAFWDLVA